MYFPFLKKFKPQILSLSVIKVAGNEVGAVTGTQPSLTMSILKGKNCRVYS